MNMTASYRVGGKSHINIKTLDTFIVVTTNCSNYVNLAGLLCSQMVTVHESPLAAGLNQTPFGYQPILVTTNPLHPKAQCCCLTFLRGHETQFLVATYVLLNQEIE